MAQTSEIWVECSKLPPAVQGALSQVGYRRPQIRVIRAETYSSKSTPAFEGSRGFVVAVNLATGDSREAWGSWGGPNPFETLPADTGGDYPLPVGGAVISGESGGRGCFATVTIHPNNMTACFAPSKWALTDRERAILAVFAGLNSRGRKDAISRHGIEKAEIALLVSMGMLKQNRAGATTITVDGRNNAAPRVPYDFPPFNPDFAEGKPVHE